MRPSQQRHTLLQQSCGQRCALQQIPAGRAGHESKEQNNIRSHDSSCWHVPEHYFSTSARLLRTTVQQQSQAQNGIQCKRMGLLSERAPVQQQHSSTAGTDRQAGVLLASPSLSPSAQPPGAALPPFGRCPARTDTTAPGLASAQPMRQPSQGCHPAQQSRGHPPHAGVKAAHATQQQGCSRVVFAASALLQLAA
jgi:hypothetical protein